MKSDYQLEKWIWNQNDFEQMGWHDNPIWAMSFDDDVKFDLDYLFKWVQPKTEGGSFNFWISPATLVFRNPSNLIMEMETAFVNGLEIVEIEKKIIEGKTNYIIEAQEGRVQIQTEEFQQIIRRPPTLQISQTLNEFERGPISFSEIPEKNFIPTGHALKCRELSYRFDELRSRKIQLQIQLDESKFDNLKPKDRILRKREFKLRIDKLIKEEKIAENEMYKAYKLSTL